MGTTQLLSVPYSLYAETAGKVEGHYIGEVFDGGIVFFVDETGQHGLMASLSDLNGGSGAPWTLTLSFVEITSGNGAGDFYNGVHNTDAIVNQLGNTGTYAAKLCADFTGGGNSDWYLPSQQELSYLYDSRAIIQSVLANDGNNNTNGLNVSSDFSNSCYWSSTQKDAGSAWILRMQRGDINDFANNKSFNFRVRAIRAF